MTLTTDLSGPCSWDIRTTRAELAAGRISHVEHLDALLERLPTAQRLGAVLDLAMADAPGAAVNHAQAAARDNALRPLAQAVREATTAAFNVVPRG